MAAGGTPSNVVMGPGRLYVATLGTTEPTSASASLPSADWRAVGYTEDGNAFRTETTSEAVYVAEELDAIRYENVRRDSQITFLMAEATRQNLALAMNIGAEEPNTAAALEPPDLGSEVRIMIVWDSDETPSADNRRWVLRKTFQSGAVEIGRRKAPQKSLIAVTFRLEKPDTGKSFIVYPNSAGLI